MMWRCYQKLIQLCDIQEEDLHQNMKDERSVGVFYQLL